LLISFLKKDKQKSFKNIFSEKDSKNDLKEK